MTLGDQRADRGSVTRVLDRAQENVRIAHQLYLAAKLEVYNWEAESEIIRSPMRAEATRELQREKDANIRSKQITDADVESKMAALHPDEYKEHRIRHTKLKGMVEQMAKLCEIWKDKARDLNSVLATTR